MNAQIQSLRNIIKDHVYEKYCVDSLFEDEQDFMIYIDYDGPERCEVETNLGIRLFEDHFSIALLTLSDRNYTKRYSGTINKIIQKPDYDKDGLLITLSDSCELICGEIDINNLYEVTEKDADNILNAIDRLYQNYPLFIERVNRIHKEIIEWEIKELNLPWEL